MPKTVLTLRTSTPGRSPVPGSLQPGQFAIEMANPTRLWVGVPGGAPASQQKLLLSSSAADMPLGGKNYLPTAGGVMTNGISWGALVGTGISDLSKHLKLHTNGYGLGVSSGRLNIVSGTGAITGIVIGAADVAQFNNAGLLMVGATRTITLTMDPTASMHAATKNYVDTKSAAAGVTSFNTRVGAVTLTLADITGAGGAPINAPVFTGDARAVTPAVGDNDTSIATTAFVKAQGYTTKGYVDLADEELQMQIDVLSEDMFFIGGLNVVTDVGNYTIASGITQGIALPAPSVAYKGFYVIVTQGGTAKVGNIPAGVYSLADWIACNGTQWVHLPIGQAKVIAQDVEIVPLIGPLGANVQTGLQWLYTNKLDTTAADTKYLKLTGGAVTGVTSFTPSISVTNGTSRLSLSPGLGGGSYNPLLQTGDSALIGDAWAVNTGALTLIPWSNSAFGIRMDNVAKTIVLTATGAITVSADPTAAMGIATKQYVDAKVSTGVGAYLPLTGGSLSGGLNVNGTLQVGSSTTQQILMLNGPAGTFRNLRWASAGVVRWQLTANTQAEDGTTNVGSGLDLISYTDAGGALKNPAVRFNRTGNVTFYGGATFINAGINFNNATVSTPANLSKHINLYNGYGFSVTGNTLNIVSGPNTDFHPGGVHVAKMNSAGLSIIGATRTVTLTMNPTAALHATPKQYVDAADQALQREIDVLAEDMFFAGGINVVTDVCHCTIASGLVDGIALPAPSVALKGFYFIVTNPGQSKAGNIPSAIYALADWIACDGVAWIQLPLGQANIIASQVAISPAIGSLGANVQTGLGWLNTNKFNITGGTVSGVTTFQSTLNVNGNIVAGLQTGGHYTLYIQGATATNRYIQWRTAASVRWQLGVNNTAEVDPQTGSDFGLYRYSNTGGYLNAPLLFSRATGLATITGDPTVPLGIATKQYVDKRLLLSGGTMTGFITLHAAPTAALHAATKGYVDSQSAAAGVTSWNTRTGAVVLTLADVTGVGGAPINAPLFTGDARAVTPAAADNDTSIATTAFVKVQGYTTKSYVDLADSELQRQIDVLAEDLFFSGGINVVTDAADFTPASALTDGPLPLPGAALKGFFVIVTQGGQSKAGNIPSAVYSLADWIVCDGIAWVRLPIGEADYIAQDVAIVPAIGSLGANVQTGLTWLNTNKVNKAGDTMTGGLSFGAALAPGGVGDVSRHIALYGTGDGIGITSGRMNIVTGSAVYIRAVAVDKLKIDAAGLTMLNGMITLTGPPTTALHAATMAYVDTKLTQAAADTRYVNTTGDTMTGNFQVGTNTATAGIYINGPVASNRFFWLRSWNGTAYVTRWGFGANAVAEAGSHAGSDFVINSYNDAGAVIGNPVLRLTRSSSMATFYGGVTFSTTSAHTGAATFTGAAVFNGEMTSNAGLSFGATAVGSATDLTRHIQLHGTTYGISVTGATINFVSGGTLAMYPAGATRVARFLAGGLQMDAGAVTLFGNPTAALHATPKQYVDAINDNLQMQIDVLAEDLYFVGGIDVVADVGNFTIASGIPNGTALPAPAAAYKGFFVIVTQGGTAKAGNIPPGVYSLSDWIVCDGAQWVWLKIGEAKVIAQDVEIVPAIGSLGANVQTGLTWLNTNKLDQATADGRYVNVTGDTMTGALNVHAALNVGNATTTQNITINGPLGAVRDIRFMIASQHRWMIRANNQAEGTGNTGNNLDLIAYDNAGAVLKNPAVRFERTGAVRMYTGLFVTGALSELATVKATGALAVSGQGAYMMWNRVGGSGSQYFVNHRGGGYGGFTFIETDGTTDVQLLDIDRTSMTVSISTGLWGAANYGKQLIIQGNGTNPSIGIADSAGANYIALTNGGGRLIFSKMGLLTATTGQVNLMTVDSVGTTFHTGGIAFGNVAVATATDLSKHIRLYATTFGFSITGSTLNVVSGGNIGMWATGAGRVANFNVNGLTMDAAKHITLSGDPTAALHAATKQYVDNHSTNGNYVKKTGDVMTGNLTVANTATTGAIITASHANAYAEMGAWPGGGGIAVGGTNSQISLSGKINAIYASHSDGQRERWAISLGDGTPESTGNAGSNFAITRYTDAGTVLANNAFTINRANGLVRAAASFKSPFINAFSSTSQWGVNGGQIRVGAWADYCWTLQCGTNGALILGASNATPYPQPALSFQLGPNYGCQIHGELDTTGAITCPGLWSLSYTGAWGTEGVIWWGAHAAAAWYLSTGTNGDAYIGLYNGSTYQTPLILQGAPTGQCTFNSNLWVNGNVQAHAVYPAKSSPSWLLYADTVNNVHQYQTDWLWIFTRGTGQLQWYFAGAGAILVMALNGTYGWFTYNNVGPMGGIGAYIVMSDDRTKTDVTPATIGLAEVLALEPINFTRIPMAKPGGPIVVQRPEIGFSAQQVRMVIPQAVGELGLELPDGTGGFDDEAPTLGMQIDPIVAALVNSVKELSAQNTALAARIATLEARTLH